MKGKRGYFNRSQMKTRLGGRYYFIYNPHSTPSPLPPSKKEVEKAIEESKLVFSSEEKINLSYRDIFTIDPGVVNCGIYVERWWSNGKEELVGCDLYSPLKETTTDYPEIIRAGDDILTFFYERLLNVHYIIIESQMFINMTTLTLMQHLISVMYFSLKDMGMCPLIIEFSPELKTKILGAPTTVKTKPDRKKWCVEKAYEILCDRGEEGYATSLFKTRSKKGEGKNKKDDRADGVCMARAFKILCVERPELKNFAKFLGN